MFKRKLGTLFLIACLILTTVPAVLGSTSTNNIHVTNSGTQKSAGAENVALTKDTTSKNNIILATEVLEGAWNKQALPHLGRHPNEYHDFVLKGMRNASDGAGGSQAEFLRLFDQGVKQPVIKNPALLRKSGWQ
jgi:hypothetical protein